VIGNQAHPSLKAHIVDEESDVYSLGGLGVPESRILPIDFSRKTKLFQSSYPKHSYFETPNESNRNHYIYTDEEEYYNDMAASWFGLSCKKGSYESLRNYEILASGSVLLYRDLHLKPKYCSPVDIPAINYRSKEELHGIMNSLVVDNKPTDKYVHILNEQRKWLIENATIEERARNVIKVLEKHYVDR
jgi:hypothetical protein